MRILWYHTLLDVRLCEGNAQLQSEKCKWNEERHRLHDQLLQLRSEFDAKLSEFRDHSNSAAILEKKVHIILSFRVFTYFLQLRNEISRLITQSEANLEKAVEEADQRVNAERTIKEGNAYYFAFYETAFCFVGFFLWTIFENWRKLKRSFYITMLDPVFASS